jgi:hypothetical protein
MAVNVAMSFPRLLYAIFAMWASAFRYFLLKSYKARAPYYKLYKQVMVCITIISLFLW